MARIRHTGPVGSILSAKGAALAGRVATFVGASVLQKDGSDSTNSVVAVPAGAIAGDLLICAYRAGNSPDVGLGTERLSWSRHAGERSGWSMQVFMRLYDGVQSEYLFAGGGGSDRSFIMAAYRGHNGTIDVDHMPISETLTGSTSSYIQTIRPLKTRRAGRYILFVASSSPLPPAAAPGGMTQRAINYPLTVDSRILALYDQPVPAGAVMDKSVGWSSAVGEQYISVPLII